jgi:hypothetical protein
VIFVLVKETDVAPDHVGVKSGPTDMVLWLIRVVPLSLSLPPPPLSLSLRLILVVPGRAALCSARVQVAVPDRN